MLTLLKPQGIYTERKSEGHIASYHLALCYLHLTPSFWFQLLSSWSTSFSSSFSKSTIDQQCLYLQSLYFTLPLEYYYIWIQNSRLVVVSCPQHFEDIIQSSSAMNKMLASRDIWVLGLHLSFFFLPSVSPTMCLDINLFLFLLRGVHCASWTYELRPCTYYGKFSAIIPSDSAAPMLFPFSGSSQKVTLDFLILKFISLNHSYFHLRMPQWNSKQFPHVSLKSDSFQLYL